MIPQTHPVPFADYDNRVGLKQLERSASTNETLERSGLLLLHSQPML
jgi:hypothetical protein